MTARETFDRWVRLIEAGDLEGVLGQYHDDAVLLRFAGTHGGKDALRDFLGLYISQRPKLLELTEFAEAGDLLTWHATMEIAGEELRVHGTMVLRGERIWRQVAAPFPTIAAAARKGAVQVELEPYTPWPARPLPDPRTAGREAIGPALLEIVAAEGPVLAGRAYRLFVRASGGKALTSIARAPLSGSAHRLRMAAAIEMEGDGDEAVLRPAGSPPVRVRELGPRELAEVPLGEIAELMRRLRAGGADDLPRAVLDTYGLVRMTSRAEASLAEAQRLSES